MEMPQRCEVGDTKQFTAVYSGVPGTTPLFTLHVGSLLVHSAAGTASGGGLFYTFVTLANSPNLALAWTWVASFSGIGPIIDRGRFQLIHTAGWE